MKCVRFYVLRVLHGTVATTRTFLHQVLWHFLEKWCICF